MPLSPPSHLPGMTSRPASQTWTQWLSEVSRGQSPQPKQSLRHRSEVYKKVLVLPTPEVLSVWLASCYSGGTRHCQRPWTIQLDDLTEHDPITSWVLTDPAQLGRACTWESDLQEKLLQRNAL